MSTPGCGGLSAPVEVYATGSTDPIRLLDATLSAGTTYRGAVLVAQREFAAFQWSLGSGADGEVASITFHSTLSNVDPTNTELSAALDAGRWTNRSGDYAFASLPSGSTDSDVLEIQDLTARWLAFVIVVAAGDDLTPFTLLSYIRR